MFESLAQGASHPAVAAWLGLGTAAVAAVVVAMAWSVNARQIRLAELIARRQFPVIGGLNRIRLTSFGTPSGAGSVLRL